MMPTMGLGAMLDRHLGHYSPGAVVLQSRRRTLARRFLRGDGLEIGALNAPLPLPGGAHARYVDRMDAEHLREHYPELDGTPIAPVEIVDDGETLSTQADASADFIVANHFLEHTQDPIGALANHLRVLRPGGVSYLAVPNRTQTFDAHRPATPLEHLVRDHHEGPEWSRLGHYEEWVRYVEAAPEAEVQQRAQALAEADYSIHFHVWTPDEFQAVLAHARDEENLPFDVEALRPNRHEFIAVLRRR
jgi:SAM-dependent methyltransferase